MDEFLEYLLIGETMWIGPDLTISMWAKLDNPKIY